MSNGVYSWARSRRTELVVFAAMGGLYFFANFQRVGVPGTIFNQIQADFSAPASAVTALAAVFLYVYAGMQIFIGAGADRFGPGKMVLTGGALLALGSIMFPFSRTLGALYTCRAIVGLGASFMYISIIKQIVNIFEPKHFPPLLGLLLVMGYSGGLVATAPLERAVRAFGWRGPFIAAGLLCAAVYAAVLLLVARNGRASAQKSTLSFGAVKELLRTREIYPILVCSSINFAIYYVLQVAVGKKFLEDCAGMSSSGAANVTFVMLLVVTVGYFFGGFLPRLAGERRKPFVVASTVGVVAGVVMLAAGVMAHAPGWWFAAAYIVLAAINSPAIVGTPLLKEVSPPATGAFAIGVLNATSYISVAIASSLAGVAMDAFSSGAKKVGESIVYPPGAYLAMFVGMVALSAVSLAAALKVPETRGVQRGTAQGEAGPAKT
jgi:MFS family permease